MRPVHFCYWLQGGRELGAPINESEQIGLIEKHLSMVMQDDTLPRAQELVDEMRTLASYGSLAQALPRLLTKLDDVFVHDIDPAVSARAGHQHPGPMRC